jgi:predicted nucleic acid-binding protein
LAARGGEQRLLRALSGCARVNLDTNAVIYYFGGGEPYGRLMKALFGLVDRGSLEVVISGIVQMELLVKPIREGNLDAVGEVIHFTERTPNIRVVDVSRPVVMQAAFVRADGLEVADSLVLSTGIVAECDATVTNDKRWRLPLARLARRPPMARGDGELRLPRLLCLDEFVDS